MQRRPKVGRAREGAGEPGASKRARQLPREIDIVPDVLLPIQLAPPPWSPGLPVERLMLAVLEEAVATYQRHLVPESSQARRELEEVQDWIESEDTSWPFSCASICDALGFDVGRLRRELGRWREASRRQPVGAGWGAPTFRRVAGSRARVTVRRGARPDAGRRLGSPAH